MGKRISMATRREIVAEIGKRYRAATHSHEKRLILDEFVALTAYHRKHALRLLNQEETPSSPSRHSRSRIYDAAVHEALIVVWESADRICSKRLKGLMPTLVEALERHGHLVLGDVLRAQLLGVSAATIDRMLAPQRAATSGRRRRRSSGLVRSQIPVRTFADWDDPSPGFVEADLVAHNGGNCAGSFVHTLVLTDIATGWTECLPLLVREQALVVEAVEVARNQLPFPLLGLDTDNDGAFINESLLTYAKSQGVILTRSRAYRKNDQAWVEQKNGAIVRRMVGHGRLQGLKATQELAHLYAVSRLYVNFFQPSFKLKEKHREGAKVTKRYHPPATPCARLLASQQLGEAQKEGLQELATSLDPLRLLNGLRTTQKALADLAVKDGGSQQPSTDHDLAHFLAQLPNLWRGGEVRPTHQQKAGSAHYWRTRPDPFATVWEVVQNWLATEPEVTAKTLFQRLQDEYPDTFPPGQLRTLQRRVQQWRRTMARRLIFGGSTLALQNPEKPADQEYPVAVSVPGNISS